MPQIGVKPGQADRPRRRRRTSSVGGAISGASHRAPRNPYQAPPSRAPSGYPRARNPFGVPRHYQPFRGAQKAADRRVTRSFAHTPRRLPYVPRLSPRDATPGYYRSVQRVLQPAAIRAMGAQGYQGDYKRLYRESNASDRAMLRLLLHSSRQTGIAQAKQWAAAQPYTLTGKDLALAQRSYRNADVTAALRARQPRGPSDAELLRAYTAAIRRTATRTRAGAAPKPKHSGTSGLWRLAAIPTLPLSAPLAAAAAAFPELGKHTVSDVGNFPKGLIVGPYELGAAGWELAHGNSRRAREVWKGLQSGPIGQTLEHGPAAGVRAFGQHPFYGALELTAGVGALGRIAGVGARTGIAGSRAAALASKTREPLYVSPEGRRIVGTSPGARLARTVNRGQLVERGGSPNLFTRLAQRGADARRQQVTLPGGRTARLAGGREAARFREDRVDKFAHGANTTRRYAGQRALGEGRQFLPLRQGERAVLGRTATLKPGHVWRQAEQAAHYAAAELNRARAAVTAGEPRAELRLARAEAAVRNVARGRGSTELVNLRNVHRFLSQHIPTLARRPETYAVGFAVERRIRSAKTYVEDLKSIRDRLNAEHKLSQSTQDAMGRPQEPWTVKERRLNRAQVHAIDAILKNDPQGKHAAGVIEAAKRYNALSDANEQRLIDMGAMTPEQALHAKLRPWAVEHRGYRYDPNPAAYEVAAARHDQLKVAEKQASREVSRTRQQYDRARYGPQRGNRERVAAYRNRHVAARKAYVVARKERTRATPHEYVTGLVDKAGRRVSVDRLVAEMRAEDATLKDPISPGFIAHRPDLRGGRSHFVNFVTSAMGRPGTGVGVRTGEATRKGAYASDMQALVEDHVRRTQLVAALGSFDRMIHEFGVRQPGGAMWTWDGALGAARDLKATTGVDLVPVRALPAKLPASLRDQILAGQDATHFAKMQGPLERRLSDALEPPAANDRRAQNVVLVPKDQYTRIQEHQLRTASTLGRVGNAATNMFRANVLPFSTKWIVGNVAEAIGRLTFNSAGPVSAIRGVTLMKTLERMDHEAAQKFHAQVISGRMYGSSKVLRVYSGPERFADTKIARPAAFAYAAKAPARVALGSGIGMLVGGPGGAIAGGLIGGAVPALRALSFGFNRALENAADYAAVGKEVGTQMHEFGQDWVNTIRHQSEAMDAVAQSLIRGHGEMNLPVLERFVRSKQRLLGKYDSFSPGMRRAIQTVVPFMPWYLNSARFLATLPVRFPLKTAVLMRVATTFDKDWAAQHKDVPPGDLNYALALGQGAYLPLARYTPVGAVTELSQSWSRTILPQYASTWLNFQGVSWKGKELTAPPGEKVNSTVVALNSALEAFVPLVAIARRFREGGATPYDNSTVLHPKTKPGTAHVSALRRIFDPTAPVYLRAGAGGSGGPGGLNFDHVPEPGAGGAGINFDHVP